MAANLMCKIMAKLWQKIQWNTCHQMASFAFRFYQIQFWPGLCPRTNCGSLWHPQTPWSAGGRDTPSPHTEQELNTKSSLLQMAEITATFPITSTCSKINKRSFQIRAILNAKQWVNTTWPNMNRLSTIHSQKQIQGEYSIQTYFSSLF